MASSDGKAKQLLDLDQSIYRETGRLGDLDVLHIFLMPQIKNEGYCTFFVEIPSPTLLCSNATFSRVVLLKLTVTRVIIISLLWAYLRQVLYVLKCVQLLCAQPV